MCNIAGRFLMGIKEDCMKEKQLGWIFFAIMWLLEIFFRCPRLRFRFPRWLSSKESTCNAEDTGDTGLIPRLGRSFGGEYGNSLQCSCLGNPMDRGTWERTVHRVDSGFPSGCVLKNLPAMQKTQETQVWSPGLEDLLEEKWKPTQVFLPGKSHGQRNLGAYSPQGRKESDMTEAPEHARLRFRLLLVCHFSRVRLCETP